MAVRHAVLVPGLQYCTWDLPLFSQEHLHFVEQKHHVPSVAIALHSGGPAYPCLHACKGQGLGTRDFCGRLKRLLISSESHIFRGASSVIEGSEHREWGGEKSKGFGMWLQ